MDQDNTNASQNSNISVDHEIASLTTLIMGGGSGTRFWPKSTKSRPKQYLNIIDKDRGLLETTFDRLGKLSPKQKRFLVTVESQKELVKALRSSSFCFENTFFEPAARNTAPCIFLSLLHFLAKKISTEEVIAILPADHVIFNEAGFRATLQKAALIAKQTKSIISLGITPQYPHPGLGHIKLSKQDTFSGAIKIDRFVEKPPYEKAVEYLKSGNYLWNAGMFVSKLSTLLEHFEQYAPDIFKYKNQLLETLAANPSSSSIEDIYGKLPSISFDYAIMEKAQDLYVLKADFDWNDLGSWEALSSVLSPIDENIILDSMDNNHYFSNARGNIIWSEENQFISLVNIHDHIVLSTKNSLTILPKKDDQKIKEITTYLAKHPKGKRLL